MVRVLLLATCLALPSSAHADEDWQGLDLDPVASGLQRAVVDRYVEQCTDGSEAARAAADADHDFLRQAGYSDVQIAEYTGRLPTPCDFTSLREAVLVLQQGEWQPEVTWEEPSRPPDVSDEIHLESWQRTLLDESAPRARQVGAAATALTLSAVAGPSLVLGSPSFADNVWTNAALLPPSPLSMFSPPMLPIWIHLVADIGVGFGMVDQYAADIRWARSPEELLQRWTTRGRAFLLVGGLTTAALVTPFVILQGEWDWMTDDVWLLLGFFAALALPSTMAQLAIGHADQALLLRDLGLIDGRRATRRVRGPRITMVTPLGVGGTW